MSIASKTFVHLQEELQQSKAALASQQQALQEASLQFQDTRQAAGSTEAAIEKQLQAASFRASGLEAELQKALRSKEASEAQASNAEGHFHQEEAKLRQAIAEAEGARREADAVAKVFAVPDKHQACCSRCLCYISLQIYPLELLLLVYSYHNILKHHRSLPKYQKAESLQSQQISCTQALSDMLSCMNSDVN